MFKNVVRKSWNKAGKRFLGSWTYIAKIKADLLTGLFGPIMKIRNLSLSSKIFVHCCLVANFHLVPEILSKIQFNSLNWAAGFFSSNCLGKYAISLKCSKIIEHCLLVQNFPPVPEMLLKIQSDPSPLGYSVFFSSNGLRKYTIRVVRKLFPKIFSLTFLDILKF